jgi:GntR family transcriptional regulator
LNDQPGYRPLYRQVYDVLVRRVAEGSWKAGESLPSEQALAKEMGVSQGTVRKVLDALTAEKLLERRQGKGTFIAQNTQERELFRFFRIARPGGQRVTPQSGGESVRVRASKAAEQRKLDLAKGDRVVEIVRTRTIDGAASIREFIILPSALFPKIETRTPLPNTLYSLYQTAYGINITTAKEELWAVLAEEGDAVMGVKVGDPILCIDRVAIALDETKVEWRSSRLATANLVYALTLT